MGVTPNSYIEMTRNTNYNIRVESNYNVLCSVKVRNLGQEQRDRIELKNLHSRNNFDLMKRNMKRMRESVKKQHNLRKGYLRGVVQDSPKRTDHVFTLR